MPDPARLLLALLIAPVAIFASHGIVHRTLAALNRRPTAHASALVAIVVTFVGLLAGIWRCAGPAASFETLACTGVYAASVYAALSILYIDVVNIAETSLHMHLLLELAWSGEQKIADLQERYSAEHMIGARIERLCGIGQLRVVDGRCYLGNRTALRIDACINAWRLILGLPTAPPAVSAPK